MASAWKVPLMRRGLSRWKIDFMIEFVMGVRPAIGISSRPKSADYSYRDVTTRGNRVSFSNLLYGIGHPLEGQERQPASNATLLT